MNKEINNNEQGLAEKIISLHASGLGFRRISQQLKFEGFRVNKDSCNRLYNTYTMANKEKELEQESKGLSCLRAKEAREVQRLKDMKEKAEIKARLNVIFVEKMTLSFEKREKLFASSDDLIRFAWRVMPQSFPAVWTEFITFCENRNLDEADAAAKSLGRQYEYERQSTTSNRERFDSYLSRRIAENLAYWRMQEQAKLTQAQDAENQLSEDNTEIIALDFSESDTWQ